MKRLGIPMPQSDPAYSVEEAEKIAARLGYPVVIRPAYTLGGTGGGLVYNVEELRVVASRGIAASMVGQILVEESVLGWEELELEVVRDAKNQMITVCFIENVDAMGVHTGDSYCAAPMLTIDRSCRNVSRSIRTTSSRPSRSSAARTSSSRTIPKTGRVVVIEINPRTSRSSALASKATGFPIALVSAKLAGGLTLDEIPYWRDGTLEKYTPSGDYVVVKFSRWAFEKFKGAQDKLGTQMRAVGEVMSIGKTYKEAFQKSIRSLENGRHGLGFAKDFNKRPLAELMTMLNEPTSERQFIMYEALRKGADVEELYRQDLHQAVVHPADEGTGRTGRADSEVQRQAAAGRVARPGQERRVRRQVSGANCWASPRRRSATRRKELGVVEGWDPVPVSGVENAAYYYSTYNAPDKTDPQLAPQSDGPRRRPEPDRTGHRVRLLLRARGVHVARRGLRDHHGQLQPGDRLHRLRHLRQTLLRAADGRGRAEHLREGKTGRRHRAVRRTDSAQHRQRTGSCRREDPRHDVRTPSIWPRTATGSAR